MSLIKRTISTVLMMFTFASTLFAGVHEDHPYEFDIRKDPYLFSTHFQIDSTNTYTGTVKKSAFRLRTEYELSDENGWQATGKRRIMTLLGDLFTWGVEIDIYDTSGVQIATVDGQAGTSNIAKFNLYEYDDEGNHTRVGVAFLDGDFDTFTLFPDENNPEPIAKLERYNVSISGQIDYWKIKVYHPEQIDDRLVRIFAAFVIDHQDKFRSKAAEAEMDDYINEEM
jgi:hypothetical protein